MVFSGHCQDCVRADWLCLRNDSRCLEHMFERHPSKALSSVIRHEVGNESMPFCIGHPKTADLLAT